MLRASIDADPLITLRQNTCVTRVDQDPHTAWAVTADHEHARADMVIGADGHRSIVRRHVAPNKPDATFAGYLIWIGIADESAIPARRWPTGLAYESRDKYILLGAPLPGKDGSTLPGHRRLGWALYDSTRNELLRRAGSVNGSVVHHSLMPDSIPAATYDELDRVAASRFSKPWTDAIRDSIARRSVIGTPIAGYVPYRLVTGRLALVGDAAHVPTPMTGSGFSESLYDAEALASAVTAETEIPAALLDYEGQRLREARSLVTSGQGFSRSFAGPSR
ncbi:FAD-dependent monooxygenase [Rathayibacter sp. Leaf299]|uniref:FAD-dependent monooxygenase n=1 Tax=Rathayibacter sp. Leaf299 TaxID=1736328 RepID=UPI001F2D309D|nr:FAD-dependent monooxygenase [Rathayibacter sp. Leaf299]